MTEGSAAPSSAIYDTSKSVFHSTGSGVPDHEADCLICGEPASRVVVVGLQLCDAHLRAVAEVKILREAAREPLPPKPLARAVVYYLLFADRIKIGWTTNLANRLANLPYDELLATEPGGRELEAERHLQFAAYRASGREWFYHCPAIAEHIAALTQS